MTNWAQAFGKFNSVQEDMILNMKWSTLAFYLNYKDRQLQKVYFLAYIMCILMKMVSSSDVL